MRVRALTTVLALASLLLTPVARAQESQPLPLAVELHGSTLSAEVIRKAIEVELGRPVALAAASTGPSLLVVAHRNRTATVSFRTSSGVTRSRTIGVPQDEARSAEVIALLSGNLSRDEAAELLASLAAKTAPAATSEPAPSAEPTPEPPPTAPPSEPAPKPKPAEPRAQPTPTSAAQSTPPPLQHTPLNLSLVAPVTLFSHTERRSINAELGLFYSRVGELRGAGLNAIALNVEGDTHGASIASIYLRNGGTVHGLGLSGLVQQSGGLEGVQLSGLSNLTSGRAQGVSAAGVLDFQQDFVGLQLAGALNRARHVEGVQAAGAVNIARRVTGLQLGVVNVADEVEGLQLGVVNVAKRVKGTSLGLVSLAGNGRIQPVFFVGMNSSVNAAMKFTVGPIYTQAGLGDGPGSHSWQYELGAGGHFPIGRWFVEPGVHYSEVRNLDDAFGAQRIEYAHYRVAIGIDLGRVSPFLGGGVLQRFHHADNAPASVPVTGEAFGGAAFF